MDHSFKSTCVDIRQKSKIAHPGLKFLFDIRKHLLLTSTSTGKQVLTHAEKVWAYGVLNRMRTFEKLMFISSSFTELLYPCAVLRQQFFAVLNNCNLCECPKWYPHFGSVLWFFIYLYSTVSYNRHSVNTRRRCVVTRRRAEMSCDAVWTREEEFSIFVQQVFCGCHLYVFPCPAFAEIYISPIWKFMDAIIDPCIAEASTTLYERDRLCCHLACCNSSRVWIADRETYSRKTQKTTLSLRPSSDQQISPGSLYRDDLEDIDRPLKNVGFLLTIIIEIFIVKKKRVAIWEPKNGNLQWFDCLLVVLLDVLFSEGSEVFWNLSTCESPANHRRLSACLSNYYS